MFKVICIDGVNQGTPASNMPVFASHSDEIYEGEIYTVVDAFKKCGVDAYILAEKYEVTYRASRFIRLHDNNLDERTIQKERELDAIINEYYHQDLI